MKQSAHYRQIPLHYYVCADKKVRRRNAFALGLVLVAALAFGLGPNMSLGRDLPPATMAQSVDTRIADLTDRLQSDDAAQREAAAAALIAIGAPARPAILKAVRSDDPGLREEAAHVLLGMAWYQPGDSAQIRQLLMRYSAAEPDVRQSVIEVLTELPDEAGIPALIRLLNEDPRPEARWWIVTSLREHDEESSLAAFRAIQPRADDPQMLALCGYARLNVDLPTALQYFRQSAELEFANATDDGGEFDIIIDNLTFYACAEKNYDLAADLLRRLCARGSDSDTEAVPSALLELFALQGDFGPLKGLDADEKLAGTDLHDPRIQYVLSKMDARMGQTAQADTVRDAAFKTSTTAKQRLEVGNFLYERGWDAMAEREYNEVLKMDADSDVRDRQETDANAHLRLSGIALNRGDDFAAARNDEQAMELLGNNAELSDGHGHPISNSDMWAKIHWHYLRAALSRHDDPEAARQMRQLIALKPADDDTAIDAVPFLEKLGRQADAQTIFDAAFAATKARLDAHPKNPELLNGLAWLCSVCDRKLPDAKSWAEQAAAIMPNDAAILDTLAQVNFQLGNAKEAVRLESKALQLDPGDDFMAGQLRRFRAGAASRPSPAPN